MGRVTKDIEIQTTSSGTEYANFSVAVDRKKNKDGEKLTDFFDCTAWSKSAAFVQKYFKKGDGILIEGRMESRKWQDKDGNNRTSWGINIDNIDFPIGKAGSGSGSTPTAEFTPVSDSEELPF